MGRTVSLGGGRVVPYPEPTSPAASAIGKANRRSDTRCEVAVRRGLHRLGFRFRKDRLIRVGEARTKADLVFPTQRLAVFIDGCFWHACPEHFRMPRSNPGYWQPKIAANVARDLRTTAALEADGWTVLRVWEHVEAEDAVATVIDALAGLRHPRAVALDVSGGS